MLASFVALSVLMFDLGCTSDDDGFHDLPAELQTALPEVSKSPVLHLPHGGSMPFVGLGTVGLSSHQVFKFLLMGGRHLDSGQLYGNQAEIGKAVRWIVGLGVRREEIFVTTKIHGGLFGARRTSAWVDNMLEEFGLAYVDLVLLHGAGPEFKPGPGIYEELDCSVPLQCRLDTWQTLADIQRTGKIRNIGVSNFGVRQMKEIMTLNVAPIAVNQLEYHPFVLDAEREAVNFCHQNKIAVTAYSPLGSGKTVKAFSGKSGAHPGLPVKNMSKTLKKLPGQILLRWLIQKNISAIPKSTNPVNMRANLDIFDFILSDEQMRSIDSVQYREPATFSPWDSPDISDSIWSEGAVGWKGRVDAWFGYKTAERLNYRLLMASAASPAFGIRAWDDRETNAKISTALQGHPLRLLTHFEKDVLHRDGLVVVPRLIVDPDLLKMLASAAQKTTVSGLGNQPNPMLYNGALRTLLLHGPLGALAASALGTDKVRASDSDVWAMRRTKKQRPAGPWHKDLHDRTIPDPAKAIGPHITVWLALTDARDAVEWLLGSHRMYHSCAFGHPRDLTPSVDQDCIDKWIVEDSINRPTRVLYNLTAGDAVVFDGGVWHRSRSALKTRIAVDFRFVPADLEFSGAIVLDMRYRYWYHRHAPAWCAAVGGPLFPLIYPPNRTRGSAFEEWPLIPSEFDLRIRENTYYGIRWRNSAYRIPSCRDGAVTFVGPAQAKTFY